MTVVADDLNLKSLEENGEANCQSNGQQVCLENVESQLFSAKGMMSISPSAKHLPIHFLYR